MLEIKEGTSLQWNLPTFEGPVPCARESHSTLTWGSKLLMYGGMNGRRLGDVWVMDVKEWRWSSVSPQGLAPLPRSLHVSAIIKNRYKCTLQRLAENIRELQFVSSSGDEALSLVHHTMLGQHCAPSMLRSARYEAGIDSESIRASR